jgi:uncharacterized protein YbjQ (UPF0145 family)
MVAEELGVDAVVGVGLDYESMQIGQGRSVLEVSVSDTTIGLWQWD